ncbi:hypothetical protein BFP72_18270 [Reichenbachiella sp. 5M10]|uniref:PDC sensor domain-containing protein n=1 Tax=Reichenbachiella sp. 5M10 TaxID=1889772 RepID=UPI000C15C6B3|nr:hypothetical protein [Reichenbachiella sp. 5M10]PIB37214.1 hypothetical protein BFP72_18270 [Reichenbachiella sp. 5M10]
MKFVQKKYLIPVAGFFLLLTLYFVYDYHTYTSNRKEVSMREGTEAIEEVKSELDEVLGDIVARANEIVEILASQELTKEEVEELVTRESRTNYYLQGVTVAYDKYGFDEETELFAPFYDKKKGHLITLQDRYDYTIDSVVSNEWFVDPLVKAGPNWTQPYMATAANLVVADYGVPFYAKGNPRPRGVVSMTLDLKKIDNKIDSLVLLKAGTGMLVSTKGRFIAHPFPEYILEQTIEDIAEELSIDEDIDSVLEQHSGYLSFTRDSGLGGYAFFSTIEHSGWKPIIVFNTAELLGNPYKLQQKIVWICLSTSVLLFMLFLILMKIDHSTAKKLWLSSIVLSLLIVINIVVMWSINFKMNFANTKGKEIVIEGRTQLESFIRKESHKNRQLGLSNFIPVETGIFLEEFQFLDAYTISIRGELWQKWPKQLSRFYEPGFRFPQEALTGLKKIEKTGVKRTKKYDRHTWNFRLNIKMPLDYSKYPFDAQDINIEVMYPDVDSGIILVPDVDEYMELSPYSMPGINQEIYFRDFELIASRFSFDIVNFNKRFGHKKYSGLNSYPIMNFSVSLKRRLLNVMVTNIIPILVVSSMIFLIFYSTTNNKEDKSGVSMMGVVQSCAGFFFVLLVAHIDLRRRLTTPELTYIETFYLTMYVIMALLAINVVTFTKTDKYKFLHYEDNLLVKISYWPVLLFAWMLITLLIFYF